MCLLGQDYLSKLAGYSFALLGFFYNDSEALLGYTYVYGFYVLGFLLVKNWKDENDFVSI